MIRASSTRLPLSGARLAARPGPALWPRASIRARTACAFPRTAPTSVWAGRSPSGSELDAARRLLVGLRLVALPARLRLVGLRLVVGLRRGVGLRLVVGL